MMNHEEASKHLFVRRLSFVQRVFVRARVSSGEGHFPAITRTTLYYDDNVLCISACGARHQITLSLADRSPCVFALLGVFCTSRYKNVLEMRRAR